VFIKALVKVQVTATKLLHYTISRVMTG